MVDSVLNKLYYEDLNFDGLNGLYHKAKKIDGSITQKQVRDWLNKQTITKELHQKIGKKEFLPIFSYSYYSYQIDLTFLPQFKVQNKNNYVLFTAININSRYAYAYFDTNKEADTILKFLERFKKDTVDIETITCDSGSEFIDSKVKQWFESNEINTYFVVGDSHKLGIINRFHRTLKNKLLKYFKASKSVIWINSLDKIIDNYNQTPIRTTGLAPIDAETHFIQNYIIQQAEDKTNELKSKEKEFEINQYVKIKNSKQIFDKFHQAFSNEVYQIIKITKNSLIVKNNDKEVKIKKSDVILVETPPVAEVIPDVIVAAMKRNKVIRKLKQVGMNEANIITTKRIPKKKTYD